MKCCVVQYPSTGIGNLYDMANYQHTSRLKSRRASYRIPVPLLTVRPDVRPIYNLFPRSTLFAASDIEVTFRRN